MIGGNKLAEIQVKDDGVKNLIGECIHSWVGCGVLKGFLDLSNGDSNSNNFNAKIQESTHIFICDYAELNNLAEGWIWDTFNFETGIIKNTATSTSVDVTSENARLFIDGKVYQIKIIDDPMGLHDHIEIYLKYTGGGLGV